MLRSSCTRVIADYLKPTGDVGICYARGAGPFQHRSPALNSALAPGGLVHQRRHYDASDVQGNPIKLRAPFPHLGFFRFVPEKQACVVERFGRFSRVLHPGLNTTIPLIESVAYTHTLKELALNVNTQQAITRDNVTIRIDGVLYIRIVDAFKASYGVDRPLYAVMQLAQTSMRSELGKMTLDNTFEERDTLNEKIVQVINGAAKTWGLECLRYEIKDILPPPGIVKAMELQAEAERRKRAQVLESEGVRQATINESEAKREAAINAALGEAQSIMRRSEATATGVKVIAEAITAQGGRDAVSMHLAQQYVDAFGNIARAGNTMIIPADAGNVASMVATAAGVFRGSTATEAAATDGGSSGGDGGGAVGGGSSGGGGGEQAAAKAEAEKKPLLGDKVLDDTLVGLAPGRGEARREMAGDATAGMDEAFLRNWVQGTGRGGAPVLGSAGGFSLSK
eukprot:jgi/Ulvmu1/6534/UM003_0168.1